MTEQEQKLVAALRSGEYRQAVGALKTYEERYCCLGVACDISGKGKFEDDNLFEDFETGECEENYLPWSVAEQLGWGHNTQGFLTFKDRRVHSSNLTLAGLNDDGFTFDQIADLIEAGLVDTESYSLRALELDRNVEEEG